MSQANYTPRRYGRSEHTPIVIDMVDYVNGDDDEYSYASHYSYSSSRHSSPRHASQNHRSSNQSAHSTHSSPRQAAASMHDFAQRRSFMMGEYEQQDYDTKRIYTVAEEQANSTHLDYNNYSTADADRNDGASESEYRQSPGRPRNAMVYDDVDARDRALSIERFNGNQDEIHSDARSFNGTPYREQKNHGGYMGSNNAPIYDNFNIPQDYYDDKAGEDDVHTAPGRVDRHLGHDSSTAGSHAGSPTKKVFYFDIDDLNQRLLKSGQDTKNKSKKKKSRSRLHKRNGRKSKKYYNMEYDDAASEILQVDDGETSPTHRDTTQRGFTRDDSAVEDLVYARDQQQLANDKHSEGRLDRNISAQREKLVDIMQRFSHLDASTPRHQPKEKTMPAQGKTERSSTPPHSPRAQSPREAHAHTHPSRETLSPTRLERKSSEASKSAGSGGAPHEKPAYNLDFDDAAPRGSNPNDGSDDRDIDGSMSQDVMRRLTLSPRSDHDGQVERRNISGGYNSGPDMKSSAMYDESANHIPRHGSYGDDAHNKFRAVFEGVQQHVADLKKHHSAEHQDLEAISERSVTSASQQTKSHVGDDLRQKILSGMIGSDLEKSLNQSHSGKNKGVTLSNPDMNNEIANDEERIDELKNSQAEAAPVNAERPQGADDPEQRGNVYLSDKSFDAEIETKNSLVYVIEEDQDGQSVVHLQNAVLSGGSTLSNHSLPDDEYYPQVAIEGIVAKLRHEALKNNSHNDDRQDPDGGIVTGGPLEPNGIKVMNVEKYDECESYKALGCTSTRTMEESRRRSFLSGDLDEASEFKADMDYACMDLDEEFEKVVRADDDVDISYNIDETLSRVARDNESDNEEDQEDEIKYNRGQDNVELEEDGYRQANLALSGDKNMMNLHEKHMSFHNDGSMGGPSKTESLDHASFSPGNVNQSSDQDRLLVGSVSPSRSQVRSPGPVPSRDLGPRQASIILSTDSVEAGAESIEIDYGRRSHMIDFAELEPEHRDDGGEDKDVGQVGVKDDENEAVSVDYDFNRAISASSHSSSTVSEPAPTPPRNEKPKYHRTVSAFSNSSQVSSDISESYSSHSSYDSLVSIVESEESDLDYLDEQEGFAESFMSNLVSSTFGWIERKQDQLVCGFKSGEFDGPSLLRESMTRQRHHGSSRSEAKGSTKKSFRSSVTKKYNGENHELELPPMPAIAESLVAEEKKLRRKKSSRSIKSKSKTGDSKKDRGRSHSTDSPTRARNELAIEGLTSSKKTVKELEEEPELIEVNAESKHQDSKRRESKHRSKSKGKRNEKDTKEYAADVRMTSLADVRSTEAESSAQEERSHRYSRTKVSQDEPIQFSNSAEKSKKKKKSRSKSAKGEVDMVDTILAASGSIDSAKYNFDFLNLSEGVATADPINVIDVEATPHVQDSQLERNESKESPRLKSSRGNAAGASGKRSLAQKLGVAKIVAKGSGKSKSHIQSIDEEDRPRVAVEDKVQNKREKSRSKRISKMSKSTKGKGADTNTPKTDEVDVRAVTSEGAEEANASSDDSSVHPKPLPKYATKPSNHDSKDVSSNSKPSKKDKTAKKESAPTTKRESRSRRKAAASTRDRRSSRPKPEERDELESEAEDNVVDVSDGERDEEVKDRRRSEALKRRRKLRKKRRAKLEENLTDDTFA